MSQACSRFCVDLASTTTGRYWLDCNANHGDKPFTNGFLASWSPASFMDDSSEIADVVGGELSSNGRQPDAVSCRDEGGVDGVVGDARVLAVKLHWGPPKHMVRVVEQAGRGWFPGIISS